MSRNVLSHDRCARLQPSISHSAQAVRRLRSDLGGPMVQDKCSITIQRSTRKINMSSSSMAPLSQLKGLSRVNRFIRIVARFELVRDADTCDSRLSSECVFGRNLHVFSQSNFAVK